MAENTRDNDQLRKMEADKGEQKDAANQPVEDVTGEPVKVENEQDKETPEGGH